MLRGDARLPGCLFAEPVGRMGMSYECIEDAGLNQSSKTPNLFTLVLLSLLVLACFF